MHTIGVDIPEDLDLLCVVGPTASGKSDLAISIAKRLLEQGKYAGVDIINADSYSLYKKLDIGTAKVSLLERQELLEQYGINHFEIDVLEPTQTSNAAEYQQRVLPLIEQLHQQNRLPILVGGSGLYIRAVIDQFEFQGVDLELRDALAERAKLEGTDVLYAELLKLDPKTAKTLDRQNTRRIIRAIEVIQTSKKSYQNQLPEYTYRFPDTLQLSINLPREMLDARIDARTLKMRELDLEGEVRGLFKSEELGQTAVKAIGYSEFVNYFEGKPNPANGKTMTVDDVYIQIAQHTKRLVRRQQSWFNRDPRIIFQ
ncbi:tRNA dimethylallyltransferase [Actinomycetota bacterium]|nr:tRNA dimethylallyltransferase [Actinomycetota bacterium]